MTFPIQLTIVGGHQGWFQLLMMEPIYFHMLSYQLQLHFWGSITITIRLSQLHLHCTLEVRNAYVSYGL